MKRKNNKNKNRDLKIIIEGDSGTGKTSFVNRYILNILLLRKEVFVLDLLNLN